LAQLAGSLTPLLVTMHVHVKAPPVHLPFMHWSIPVPSWPSGEMLQRYPPFATVSPKGPP
jgi:hypothetical protein